MNKEISHKDQNSVFVPGCKHVSDFNMQIDFLLEPASYTTISLAIWMKQYSVFCTVTHLGE